MSSLLRKVFLFANVLWIELVAWSVIFEHLNFLISTFDTNHNPAPCGSKTCSTEKFSSIHSIGFNWNFQSKVKSYIFIVSYPHNPLTNKTKHQLIKHRRSTTMIRNTKENNFPHFFWLFYNHLEYCRDHKQLMVVKRRKSSLNCFPKPPK